MMAEIKTSYVICAVQRSGSSLLCEVLKNTGLAGVPEEYFLYHPEGSNWENSPWAQQNGATTRQAYIDLVRERGTTANGVFGTKLMWNYFPDVISWLQEMPAYRTSRPASLLEMLFPNLHYIWMIRDDKVRQAVSWSMAAQTGMYAAWQATVQSPKQKPVYDFEQIDLLCGLILEGEAGWGTFFESNAITPMKVIYEELVAAYEETGLRILDFLGVPYPDDLVYGEDRRLKKQATRMNEEWAQRYREMKSICGGGWPEHGCT